MCKEKVLVDVVGIAGTPVYRTCGTWYGGEQFFCDSCTRKWQKEYPQGWRFYPGDVCRHGCYVGGVMEDNLCFYCEQGEE